MNAEPPTCMVIDPQLDSMLDCFVALGSYPLFIIQRSSFAIFSK
jgi:hypothetical protein